MNKKGFTLIEVIGVVVVLSLLLIVAVPSLTKTLKNNEQKKYDDYIAYLEIAAENYIVDKLKEGQFFTETEENGDSFNYLSLGDLIDAGYIKNTIKNPKNNKVITRDTRIKVTKQSDGTFKYSFKPYYNSTDDYNKDDLIIHYDSVEYSPNNVFKSLTNEVDYDYSTRGTWTEDGIYFDKDKSDNAGMVLNNVYSTNYITVSYNIESLDELGGGGQDYTYPVVLPDSGISIGFRADYALFYGKGHSSQFAISSLVKNKNYTITFVQDGITTRKIYVNGINSEINSLNLQEISYDKIKINPRLYNIKLNNVLIYNRVLSDSEIQELYELDKERFGE